VKKIRNFGVNDAQIYSLRMISLYARYNFMSTEPAAQFSRSLIQKRLAEMLALRN